ncbi:hypothetical protein TRL7639_00193 [Falsiruegeria litorea R37]|uniref:Uncharacterized protein n=1 Tax=Falsiruegeria litorea R37 TaxID=1200284 RepID=A0A1Y5RC89_9RHOB|nr:hypothetical protein [Falsiruegeria litorea]SLN14097.1 hypothetical protein TRL7639_00193 [Falsiruegeria litorea R37]
MSRLTYMLQMLFAVVLTAGILLQGLTGVTNHLPQIDLEGAAQINDHGHSHDPVVDVAWSDHGHSHDVTDHDHNPGLTVPSEDPSPLPPLTKDAWTIVSLMVWDMQHGLERPPRV